MQPPIFRHSPKRFLGIQQNGKLTNERTHSRVEGISLKKGSIRVLAIELKICLVIAMVSDFKDRRQSDDAGRNETEPAIGSGPKLRPASEVERMLATRACASKER